MDEATGTRYSLNELTGEAAVSARTVRYYITEGLLPPPIVAGARSYYTQEHLDRLKLVNLLKENYLPLREIRKRLTGMSAAEITADLDSLESHGAVEIASVPQLKMAALRDVSAVAYVDRLLHAPAKPGSPVTPGRPPGPPVNRPLPIARQRHETAPPVLEQENWRRIAISEEAELLVSEREYERHQEQIDWLIDWAHKVFG